MRCAVIFHKDFEPEFDSFEKHVKKAIASAALALEVRGPLLGRPYVDTLKASSYSNMKELRVTVHDGEWRVAFAFDKKRNAILLVGASKSGMSGKRFYKQFCSSSG